MLCCYRFKIKIIGGLILVRIGPDKMTHNPFAGWYIPVGLYRIRRWILGGSLVRPFVLIKVRRLWKGHGD